MRVSYMGTELASIFGKKELVGAEIGVLRGEHADFLLSTLNIKKLYLIDPFNSDDPDYHGYNKPLLTDSKDIATNNLRGYSDKIEWLFMKSSDAFQHLKNDVRLDFIYLDGNHSYDYIYSDIESFISIIKSNGYIGGHDYLMSDPANPVQVIEVKKAVDTYVRDNGCNLTVRGADWPDWWFPKLQIHFVWLGPTPFLYINYLAIRTAFEVYKVKPYLWVDSSVPINEWYSQIGKYAIIKSLSSDDAEFIANTRIQPRSFISNYLRYKILYEFGGLYLDTDTICVKSIFDLDLKGVTAARENPAENAPINNAVIYV